MSCTAKTRVRTVRNSAFRTGAPVRCEITPASAPQLISGQQPPVHRQEGRSLDSRLVCYGRAAFPCDPTSLPAQVPCSPEGGGGYIPAWATSAMQRSGRAHSHRRSAIRRALNTTAHNVPVSVLCEGWQQKWSCFHVYQV